MYPRSSQIGVGFIPISSNRSSCLAPPGRSRKSYYCDNRDISAFVAKEKRESGHRPNSLLLEPGLIVSAVRTTSTEPVLHAGLYLVEDIRIGFQFAVRSSVMSCNRRAASLHSAVISLY